MNQTYDPHHHYITEQEPHTEQCHLCRQHHRQVAATYERGIRYCQTCAKEVGERFSRVLGKLFSRDEVDVLNDITEGVNFYELIETEAVS